MAYKASAHAVYDLQYHLVWTPKYRKAVLVGEIAQAVQALFYQIAEAYDMEIDTMEVMEDHVHLFLSAPPRYAPARMVQILKSLSARELFARFPRLRRQLWGGAILGGRLFCAVCRGCGHRRDHPPVYPIPEKPPECATEFV